jgi:hypothetical protein
MGWFNTDKNLMCIIEDYPYQDALLERLKGKVQVTFVEKEKK